MREEIATRQSFGEAMSKNLEAANKNVVVIDADLAKSTKTSLFAKKIPR